MTTRWLLVASLFLGTSVGSVAIAAPTPPIDPKMMSGIPRPDPQVPPGQVTVRVLGEGGFAEPLVGVEVTLEITPASGGAPQTRVATTIAEGRATFEDLASFVGGQAVARVAFAEAVVASQPIALLAETGSRVMLVRGAMPRGEAAAAGSQGPTGAPGHGTSSAANPLPGDMFPLSSSPPGVLTVGVFDLGARRGLPGIEVTLATETGSVPERKATTDVLGKVVFDDLLAEDIPAETVWTVSAVVVPGAEPQQSRSFTMPKDTGAALVLAHGEVPREEVRSETPRRALPGPRVLPSLTPGVVQVRVVGAKDEPIPAQTVIVTKQSAAGTDERYEATTNDQGLAVFSSVPMQGDAVYSVTVPYDGAPYRSPLFLLEERGGVAVDLRVFPVTRDRTVLRSAVQFDLEERENDLVQVVQVYEAVVSGDRAFWDPEFELSGVKGAKGLIVLRPAEPWLKHEEKAPSAHLAVPLPPEERVNLSIGYLLEHDGEVDVSWTPPFATVESSMVVPDTLSVEGPGATRSDLKAPVDAKAVYVLGGTSLGGTAQFHVEGLRVSNPVYRILAAILGGIMLIAAALGAFLRPRGGAKVKLERRKEELITRLEQRAGTMTADERERVLSALDRVHRQLRALDALGASS